MFLNKPTMPTFPTHLPTPVTSLTLVPPEKNGHPPHGQVAQFLDNSSDSMKAI